MKRYTNHGVIVFEFYGDTSRQFCRCDDLDDAKLLVKLLNDYATPKAPAVEAKPVAAEAKK